MSLQNLPKAKPLCKTPRAEKEAVHPGNPSPTKTLSDFNNYDATTDGASPRSATSLSGTRAGATRKGWNQCERDDQVSTKAVEGVYGSRWGFLNGAD